MCSLTVCPSCKKFSFVGCGKHLTLIFAGKKPEELCVCNEKIREYIKQITK